MFDINFDTDLTNLLKKEEELENKAACVLDLVVESAEGNYLVDTKGKRYLDLTSNKECNPLGYSHVSNTDSGYLFDSELFTTTDSFELKNTLTKHTGMEKVIFTSSRAESYCIYKELVKNYLNSSVKNKILISALSSKQEYYDINDAVTQFIPINNDIIAMSILTKAVGAVVVDIVQVGEEINIATLEYLKQLRNLCDKCGALLVLDATSVSPLRTLNGVFNYDSSIIKPDILIISNSAAQGIPFGAVLLSDKLEEIQSYGSTICAYKSALKFINECTFPETINIIRNNANYLEKSLNDLAQKFITIVDVISYGMMFSIVLDISSYSFVQEAFKRGVIIDALNSRTIKLSPPYNISKDDVDRLIVSFEEILDTLARFDRL